MTNDANSNIPSRDPEVLTTPEEWRRPSLFRWIAVVRSNRRGCVRGHRVAG